MRVVALFSAVLLLSGPLFGSAPEDDGFVYPRPTGEHRVGTRFLFLEDADRPDAYTEDPEDRRWISIKAWYPASPEEGAEPDVFGDNDFTRSLVEAGVFDSLFTDEVAKRPTYSYPGAPVAPGSSPWPAIIYSSSGVITANTFLYEQLASHGYVVLAVGHPHWCEFYFDQDGEMFYPDKQNRYYVEMWREEASQEVIDTKELITRAATSEEKMQLFRELNKLMPTEVSDLRLWKEDIDFLLERLEEINSVEGPLQGALDTGRIGIFGYSKGGALAGQFCATDGRIRAGINLGGFGFGDIVEHDLEVPFMFMEHVEPWCEGCLPINLPFFDRAKSDAYMVQVEGALHGNFTDLPLVSGYIVPNGIVGPLDGETSAAILGSYTLAFFDTYVKGLSRAPILDRVPSQFPQARFSRR
jgi:hypothetical protein